MPDDATTPLSRRTLGTARRLWGLVHVRAAACLVGGVVLFANPDEGLVWLRWLLGLVILAQGVLLALEGVQERRGDGEVGWRLVAGLVSVGAALVIVLWPSMSAPALFLVVGLWACAAGVTGAVGALRARAVRAPGWDWRLANAALWLVLGVVVLARPTDDQVTVGLLLALYLLMTGAVLLVGGLATGTRVRDARRSAPSGGTGEQSAGPG
ncbi:HdeD family acid-resistance protein [Isoptericola sp. BMS4]|uniref:HdeD family acid-resistance protein n=1 Tax=Isoptericola sp. BMS4 TaxID=2527875 RepID=UPI00142428A3|nr:DUF308 domain-containing protein [Isoptericola sp. BMS4]